MSTPRRTVAIIPARFASQRLPGKPLAEIHGKPMICHVVERTARARLVSDVLVATDDQRIADAVQGCGGRAVMTPASLQSGTDRIAWVARTLDDAELVVNVQGDEPLIPPEMIDQAICPLLEDDRLVAGTLVKRIQSTEELLNPSLPKVVLDANGFCLYFSRSPIPFGRDLPQTEWMEHQRYFRHIGLYVFRRTFLLEYASWPQTPLEKAEKLEQLRILEHGERIRAVVTDLDSIAVDTPADLERVRTLMSAQS